MKSSVSYPGYGENGQTFVAERAIWGGARKWAPEILRITGEAYLAELVRKQHARDIGGRLLTEASVRRQYEPTAERVEAYVARDNDFRRRGASLVVLRSEPGSDELIGYARIAPAPGMTENAAGGHDYEGWYLNNLVVNPVHGRKGFGGLVLHGALALAEAQPEDPLVLDAINANNRVNAWYRKLGFEPDPATPTGNLRFGPQLVPETYYVAPNVGGVVLNLELGRPALAGAIVA